MSAVAHPVRNKMFGFFKNFLRRQATSSLEEQVPAENDIEVVDTTEIDHSRPHHSGSLQINGHSQNGSGVELPLEPILKGLPLELQPRLKQMDVGDATIYIPLAKILAQLSRGVVNI